MRRFVPKTFEERCAFVTLISSIAAVLYWMRAAIVQALEHWPIMLIILAVLSLKVRQHWVMSEQAKEALLLALARAEAPLTRMELLTACAEHDTHTLTAHLTTMLESGLVMCVGEASPPMQYTLIDHAPLQTLAHETGLS